MIIWDIFETRAGTYDVTKSGRSFAYDLLDQDEAERKIKRSRFYNVKQTVILHSKDGYRRSINI